MSPDEIRKIVLETLKRIAPEADIGQLNPDEPYREQFDFDSVDFLNFALKLQETFGTIIPELEFPKLASLNGCVAFIEKILTNRS